MPPDEIRSLLVAELRKAMAEIEENRGSVQAFWKAKSFGTTEYLAYLTQFHIQRMGILEMLERLASGQLPTKETRWDKIRDQ